MKKLSKTVKGQVTQFINQGHSLVYIINYLYTCDYDTLDIAVALIKDFKCNEQIIRDIFKVDYEIEFDNYILLSTLK